MLAAPNLSPEFGLVWGSVLFVLALILGALAWSGLVRRRLRRGAIDLVDRSHAYRSLVENSPLLIMRWNRDLRYTYANPAVEHLLAIPYTSIVGRRTVEIEALARGLAEEWERLLRLTLEKTSPQFLNFEMKGRYYEAVMAPEMGGKGWVDAVVGVAWDSTPRWQAELALKQSQEALKRSEVFLSNVIDQSPFSLWITDDTGTVIRQNEASRRLLGLEGDRGFTGHYSLYADAHIVGQGHLPRIEQVFREGLTVSLETEIDLARSGFMALPERGSRLVEMTISPLRDRTDRVVSALVHLRDITEERALEGQLRESQKMEAIGRLAGGVAHDFNNLLTAMSGYTELAMLSINEDSPLRRDLIEVRKAADRAAALTQQLLAFSRRQVLQPRIVDVNRAIHEVKPLLARLIGEDIELVLDLDEKLPRTRADRGQLDQMLLNLAVNSRDAMPRGGRITITTREQVFGPDQILPGRDLEPGRYLRLEFLDTGEGMAPEVLEHIFEPFFTTKEPGKGTGLGLATVYGIARQHGGSVTCASRPGEGACFAIFLPVVECADEDPSSSRTRASAMRGGAETILLVEDEEAVRCFVERTLGNIGYRVMSACDGRQALQALERFEGALDLLLTDVVMPGMSGRELARHVQLRHPEAKILFISGYAGEALQLHGVAESGEQFLAKPFGPGALACKVRDLLDG